MFDHFEITAYHEAAHAYWGVMLGGQLQLVTIEPENGDVPDCYGETRILWDFRGQSPEAEVDAQIRVCLAGPVAEMIFTEEPYHPLHLQTGAADWETAWKICETLLSLPRRRLEYLEQITRDLYRLMNLPRHWHPLAAIADALLAEETLEGDAVLELLEHWQDL